LMQNFYQHSIFSAD